MENEKVTIDATTYKNLQDAISRVFLEDIPEAIAKNFIEVKITKLYLGYTAILDGTIHIEGTSK